MDVDLKEKPRQRGKIYTFLKTSNFSHKSFIVALFRKKKTAQKDSLNLSPIIFYQRIFRRVIFKGF